VTHGLATEVAGTGVRVNSVEPRAAVMSEGATALIGDRGTYLLGAHSRSCSWGCRIRLSDQVVG